MSIPEPALAKMPLFSALPADDLTRIASMVHAQEYAAGETILHQGDACPGVYLVAKGVVRSWRVSSEGREQVLSYLGPGNSFGIVAVLDGSGSPAGVDAVFPTTLYFLSARDFRGILHDHQAVSLRVAQHLAREVRRLSEMVEDLALHTVRARLARFLLTRVDQPSGPHRWTQEAIATYIGTVREMVARSLRAMVGEGLIRRERGRIVILDREGLEREAGLQG